VDDLDELLASEPADPDALPPFDTDSLRPLRWAIPAVALTLTSALVFQQRADFDYLAASPTPVDLGAPGDYHLERARKAVFVHIRGNSGPEASLYRKLFLQRELVPFVDAPVIIDRPRSSALALPTALDVEGRLEPDDRQLRFRDVIRYFLQHDQLAPPGVRAGTSHVWIIADGQRPRSLGWNAAWCALLLALLAFNVAWLWRRLAR
jgi:hypothetical protein